MIKQWQRMRAEWTDVLQKRKRNKTVYTPRYFNKTLKISIKLQREFFHESNVKFCRSGISISKSMQKKMVLITRI